MNNNMKILTVAASVVLIALFASFISSDKGSEGPDQPSIVDEWNLVSVYTGEWVDGVPLYSVDTMQDEKVRIEPYKGDFYIFDDGADRLYCSWGGERMITSGIDGMAVAVYISQLPKNDNFMTAAYFEGTDAVVKLYQRQGYVGSFPGFTMPADLPKVGDVMSSFKNREYTDEGAIDHGVNTLTVKLIEGNMVFYNVLMDDLQYNYVSICIGGNVFATLGAYEDSYVYDMTEFKNGVMYTSSFDLETRNIWVTEYGDESKKEYPDKYLSSCEYVGTENYVMFKEGEIVEEGRDNNMTLIVLGQEDEILSIFVLDEMEAEAATWTALFNDSMTTHHYGISVHSYIEYKGVLYWGHYTGYFKSSDCNELVIHGSLSSAEGYDIVISQEYRLIA